MHSHSITDTIPTVNPFATGHLTESLASVLERLSNPYELTPEWLEAQTTGRIGSKPDAGGNALAGVLRGLESQAAVDLERETPSFPYRPNQPILHERQAVRGDVDAELVRLILAQRAVAEFEEMTGSLKGPDSPLKGTRHLLLRATRPQEMTCRASTAWSEAILPDGSIKIRHQPCGECDNCLAWRRRENALRFVYVAADVECTTIQVSGWASSEWDKAAVWLDAMGRRQPGQRWRGLRPAEDYTPTATVIYPCELSAEIIELAKSDAARKGLTLTAKYEAVSVAAFGGIQDTLKTRTGNVLNKETGKYVRHCTSRFVAWPDFEESLPDYVTGDTVVHQSGKDVELPDETPATDLESNLRSVKDVEHRAESAAYIRMGRVEYLDIGLFLNLPNEPDRDGEVMQTIKRREHGGSSQLLIDAALHYVGDTPYRAAYCAVYERVFGDDWAYGGGA